MRGSYSPCSRFKGGMSIGPHEGIAKTIMRWGRWIAGGMGKRTTASKCFMDSGSFWRRYIGDAKFGRLVGQDHFGNKYYENTNAVEEVPGRHRWIDFAQHDYNASQVPPEWHSWLGHIRELPPHEDPIIAQSTPPWKTVSRW